MKHSRTLIFAVFVAFICIYLITLQNDENETPGFLVTTDTVESAAPKQQVPTIEHAPHSYSEMNLPSFLDKFVTDHIDVFRELYKTQFEYECHLTDIDPDINSNQESFFKFLILNKLFTSDGAISGSTSGILKIPYFWHWTNPNPREEIIALPDSLSLAELSPPEGFSRYSSKAHIDRTPIVYLSDLVSEKPQYYHNYTGPFYTFGWCSEREMAFCTLMNIYGYSSKVTVSGNHSWSEVLTNFVTLDGKTENYVVKVDNTFDFISLSRIEGSDIENWKDFKGYNRLGRWYNNQPKEILVQEKVSKIKVKSSVSDRIENMFEDFLLEEIATLDSLYRDMNS